MTANPRRRIGDIVLEAGLITREQLEEALEYQRLWGHKLGTALVAKKFLTEFELIDLLARELGLETTDPLDHEIDPDVLALVPKKLAAEHDVLPLGLREIGHRRKLLLAMSDPMNYDAVAAVRAVVRLEIEPVIATMTSVAKAIRLHYGVMSAASKLPAFADSEMIIIQPGGSELKVGPSGVEQPLRQQTQHDPFAAFGAPTQKASPQQDTTHVPRKLNYPPPAAPMGLAYPPPQMPIPPGYPLQGFPMAPGFPSPMPAFQQPPMMAPPFVPSPPAPPPEEATVKAAKPPAPGAQLRVMEEISKYSPKELMLAIVRALLKKGVLSGDELLAELRKMS